MTCLQVIALMLCPLSLTAGEGDSLASVQERPPLQVEIGGSYEVLSGDREAWRDAWIRVRQPLGPRRSVHGMLLRAERFGLVDYQASAGAVFPLDNMTAHIDGSFSPNPSFLSVWGIGGNLHVPAGGPWATRFGGGFEHYPGGQDVTSQFGALEWRAGRLGAAYRLTASQLDGEGGLAHTLSGTLGYAGASSATLMGTVGRRAVLLGPGDVRIGDTRGVGLLGFHEIQPGVGISYHIGFDDHAGVFTRSRVQVGVRVLP